MVNFVYARSISGSAFNKRVGGGINLARLNGEGDFFHALRVFAAVDSGRGGVVISVPVLSISQQGRGGP